MQKYITFGWNSLVKELFVKPKNQHFIKPIGGLWACKYTPDQEYISDWQRWCADEDFYTGRMDIGVVFNLSEKARVYTIDKYKDFEWLIEKYKDPKSSPTLPTLDFERLSEDYDVIELTDNGQCDTRWTHPISLYGWDVECILILNFDAIGEQEEINQLQTAQ